MLSLYSDGSYDVDAHIAVCTSLVLDDETNICHAFFTTVYGCVMSSEHGELLGVYQSLSWMADNHAGEKYRICVDNKPLALALANHGSKPRVVANDVSSLWFEVFGLVEKLGHPCVWRVPAHVAQQTPNKACDLFASSLLRYIRREKPECTPLTPLDSGEYTVALGR